MVVLSKIEDSLGLECNLLTFLFEKFLSLLMCMLDIQCFFLVLA